MRIAPAQFNYAPQTVSTKRCGWTLRAPTRASITWKIVTCEPTTGLAAIRWKGIAFSPTSRKARFNPKTTYVGEAQAFPPALIILQKGYSITITMSDIWLCWVSVPHSGLLHPMKNSPATSGVISTKVTLPLGVSTLMPKAGTQIPCEKGSSQ